MVAIAYGVRVGGGVKQYLSLRLAWVQQGLAVSVWFSSDLKLRVTRVQLALPRGTNAV
jgi:hypothetical protein